MKRKYTPQNALGPLSARSTNLPHFLPVPQDFAASTRVTNSMMPNLKPGESIEPRPYIRPGADHRHIPSVGQGC